jgi:putative hydrolase of the HAD superfamily
MRIEAVFFDFDGVLTTDRTGSLTTLRYLSDATGIELARLQAAFREYNDDLNLGRTTHERIWPSLCRRIGREVDIGLLPAAFASTPLNAPMFELARRLKQSCRIGIITDNKKDRVDFLKGHAGLVPLFDPIVVSAEVGADKQGNAIFERALALAATGPVKCIFIDNTAANLEVPRAMGMHAIHFDDAKNDVDSLGAILESGYGLRGITAA